MIGHMYHPRICIVIIAAEVILRHITGEKIHRPGMIDVPTQIRSVVDGKTNYGVGVRGSHRVKELGTLRCTNSRIGPVIVPIWDCGSII